MQIIEKIKLYKKTYKVLIKPFIIEQLICGILLILYSATSLVFPYFLKLIIDDAIGKNNIKKLILYTIGMLVTVFIMLLSRYFQSLKLVQLAQKVIYQLKQLILEKLFSYSNTFFNNYKVGEIVSILENDVENIRKLATDMISDLIVNFITAVGLFIVLFNMNAKIALASIILVIGYTYLQRLYGFKMRTKAMNLSKNRGELQAQSQQLIGNLEEIKKMNANIFFKEKYNNSNKQYFNNEKDVVITRQCSIILGTIFQSLGLVLVLCYGGIQVLNGLMTLGILFSLTLYIQRIYTPIISISSIYIEFRKIQASLKRVFDIINNDKYLIEDGDEYNTKSIEEGFVIKNLTFGYGRENLIEETDIEIGLGDKIALIGSNGCGKTTLLKILMRIQKEYYGEIIFNKLNIKQYNLDYFRRNVYCIGQKIFIFNGTVFENITLDKKGISYDEVNTILKLVRLEDDVKSMPNGLNTMIG